MRACRKKEKKFFRARMGDDEPEEKAINIAK